MDAMLGTLQLVAQGRWMTILPGVLCFGDADGRERRVSQIVDPPMINEFVVIEPSRRTLSQPAALFLEAMRAEIDRLGRFPND